jgi:repressor LexA
MDRQREIYNFIRDEISKRGLPPTIREIGEKFDISSTNGVRYFLHRLEEEGLIMRKARTARGICLALKDEERNHRSVPVLGRVPAGGLEFGEENIESHILVDERFVRGNEVFAVMVKGDSMIGAGINDGDIAVVKKNPDPISGEIVVALIDDEVTLKRLIKKGKEIYLKPENRRYGIINLGEKRGRNIVILGTLEAIMRKY